MPTQTGFIVPTPFPDTASPGALPLGADVPAGANLCVALLSGSNDAGVTLDSLASNFTTAGFVLTNHPGFTGYGVQFGVAQVNSSGSGKTLTPVWSTTLGYGPTCTLLFFNVSDPAACIAELSAEGTRLQLDNSSDTTPKVLNVSADSVADLVYAHDCKYTTSSVIPGLDAAYTNVTTQADLRGATTRTSRKTAVTVGTNSGTTTDTDYSALAVFVIRDIGGGGDTTAPTLSSAAGAATGSTTASGSVSTDEANGTLYRVTTTNASESAATVKAGASQAVTATGVQNMGATGLAPSTTYRHHYLHRDAAGNDSAVLSTATFTTSASDTTAPTLSSPTGAATGTSTASGGVTTNEANGTLYAVTTTSATQPTAAQIRDGQNHLGATAPWAGNQAVSSTGAKPIAATGLAAGTGYYHHFHHRDAAGNDSAVVSSALFTTTAADTTAPTLSSGIGTVKSNALIVVGATTNEANGTMYAVLTTSATPPSAAQVRAGQNNAGTAAAWADSLVISSTGAKTFNANAPAAATGYYPYLVHRDAAGNDSAVMSVGLRTTFRNGATGQYILDHPDSFMAQCIEAGDEDAWFDWEQVTGPASGTWVEGPYADGTGVFEGPDATTMVIRLRKNGVVVGDYTVNLYDPGHYATPADSVSGSTSTPSNALQTYRATPAGAQSGASVSSTSAVQVQVATPANAVSGSTATPSNATQTHRATPADSVSGATVTSTVAGSQGQVVPANSVSGATVSSSTALQTYRAAPANANSGATVGSSSAIQAQAAMPSDSVSGSTSSASAALQTYQATPSDGQSGATVGSTRAFAISREPSSDVAFYPVRNNRTGYPVY